MRRILFLLWTLVICFMPDARCQATTLQRAFELAEPAHGYDKYLELETGQIYTGGLMIGPSLIPYSTRFAGGDGLDVRIVGNGAILDLQGQQICISYCNNALDIDDCVVLNGDIRFRGFSFDEIGFIPTGSVRHVTLFAPHDYGIRMQHTGGGITLERNIVVNAVDTGFDFIYTTGIAQEFLPTGTSISGSWTAGEALVRQNWSYHSDAKNNNDPLAHFSFL